MEKRMSRGYYLTVDVTIATAFAIIAISMILITLLSAPASNYEKVGTQRFGESLLYTLKNDGALTQIVQLLDNGHVQQGKAYIIPKMKRFGMNYDMRLEIKTYDSSMNSVHNFTINYGTLKKESFSASLAFKPDSNPSKFAIATIYVGS
ncbi:MAG: hypothetical protein J7K68_02425 [Candidatus Diapherotrites archaeon]|nr:hypothetical protein [Candidatus Diapherotrites archaeon]